MNEGLEFDSADVDWRGTAEALQAELMRYRRVVGAYVSNVESGECFDALAALVRPGPR